MRQYLDLSAWVFLFALLPVTVLILLSQNTIPGDLFYPVKRGMENMILVAASVSPTTKVAFRTDLTQRRFSEAQELLVSKADTSAYDDFVTEISSAQEDLTNLGSAEDRIESSTKLIAKIEEYQTQLTQTQTQVQIAQALPAQPVQTFEEPTQVSQPFVTQQPTSTPVTQSPTPVETPSQTSQPTQTTTPTAPSQPQTQASPAPTSAPLTPTVTNTIANNPVKAEEVKEKIKNTKEHLEKVKEELKKEKEDAEFRKKVQEEIRNERKNGPSNDE